MRVPQVSERIKEAPAQALRGVFAGIGQLLLITDKLRNKAPTDPGVPRTRRPEPTEPVTDSPAAAREEAAREEAAAPAHAQPAPAEAARAEAAPAEAARAEARDFDKTGNVRLLDDEGDTAAVAQSPVAAERAPGESAPPLPNYDELSIASLRARLRNLDVMQLMQVAEYERAHEARADVIAMFERRVAKLAAEDRPEAGI